MFREKRIKELREEKTLLQRQLAAEFEIASPMYNKIERGERKAKREQVLKLTELLNVNSKKLLVLWLAGQVYELVKNEDVAKNALKIVEQNI